MGKTKHPRLPSKSVVGSFSLYQGIALFLIVLVAIVAGYTLTYQNSVNRLQQEGKGIIGQAAGILSRPLWNFDKDTLAQYTEIFLNNSLVNGVQIRDERGQIVMEKHHMSHPREQQNQFSMTRPIYFNKMNIGTVTMTFSIFQAYSRARHTVMIMALMSLIFFIAVLFTSILQLRRFVIHPLRELGESMKEIAEGGEYSKKLSLIQKREFERIASEFNAMIDQIRKREEEIASISNRYRFLMNAIPDTFFLHTRTGEILQVNDTFTEMYGYEKDEIPNLSLADDLSGDGYSEAMAREQLFLAWERGGADFRWMARRKDGTEFPVEVRLKRIELNNEKYIMAVVRDITRREKAEQALRESEEKFRAMTDHTTAAIFIYHDKFIFANPASEKLSGYSLQEFYQRNFWDLVHPDHRELVKQRGMARIKGENIQDHYTFKIITKNGKTKWIDFSAQRILYEGKWCSLGTAMDITDKITSQDALREEKERLRITLQSIGDAVIATDNTGKILLLNPVASQLCGWDETEAVGEPVDRVFTIIHELTREPIDNPVETVMKSGRIVNLSNHTVLIGKNGEEHIIADSGAPIRDKTGTIIGVVLVFRDETEKKQVEEELFKTRKLESIGLLAGGIAHDFNNLLTAIMGNLDMARIKCDTAKSSGNIQEAKNAAIRARDLARQLLTFSKGGAPIRKRMDIANLLEDTTNFILAGAAVSPRFFIAPDLYTLSADEGQISQVIQNIVLNAKQAMPEGGLIDIAAENTELQGHPTLPNGPYVRIFIRDYGVGIPAKFLTKIFDPYFTTKEEGNGLGLSTAYSIITRHEGYIDVSSKPGAGTTFTILLPAIVSSADENILPEEEEEGASISATVSPLKILIMDDEDAILEILGEMLSFLGHRVMETLDGKQAIEQFRKAMDEGEPFDLVILDLTVPGGLSGKETIVELLKLKPDIKAIVSSGYANDPVMAQYREHGFHGVVNKPFQMQELSETIRQVMSSEK
ncbi:MAG: PAS domain S-box protein [Acidobacteria bacterium]|nr:PAS domain S-box protein [Acidobacteriota bacterium]